MTGPLLHVLGLMPRAMFAGVFLVVGWGSVEGNGKFRDAELSSSHRGGCAHKISPNRNRPQDFVSPERSEDDTS